MVGQEVAIRRRSRRDRADFSAPTVHGWLESWQRTWAQVACGAAVSIGLFLLWRRFDGGLQQPLGWQSLIAVAISLIIIAACVRAMWSVAEEQESSMGRRLLPAFLLVAVGLAVSLPLTNGFALVGFWVLLIGSECLSWFRSKESSAVVDFGTERLGAETGSETDAEIPLATAVPVAAANSLAAPVDAVPESVEAFEDAPEDEGQVIQKLTRTRNADGQEVLSGQLRADFPIDDRMARLHVAFCPPLERLPQVYAEATHVDEHLGEVTVKVAQVLTLGTRIDVELVEPAIQAGAVQVEFYAAVEDER